MKSINFYQLATNQKAVYKKTPQSLERGVFIGGKEGLEPSPGL